jgi:hypothetical protein
MAISPLAARVTSHESRVLLDDAHIRTGDGRASACGGDHGDASGAAAEWAQVAGG